MKYPTAMNVIFDFFDTLSFNGLFWILDLSNGLFLVRLVVFLSLDIAQILSCGA